MDIGVRVSFLTLSPCAVVSFMSMKWPLLINEKGLWAAATGSRAEPTRAVYMAESGKFALVGQKDVPSN